MDAGKILNAISKIIQILNKSFKQIYELKRYFLNHPKILEYLFSHTIVKVSTLNRALETVSDDTIPKVNVEMDNSTIYNMFLDLYTNLNRYLIDYEQYRILVVKYYQLTNRKLDLAKRLDFLPKITTRTKAVQNYLEKISADYLPNWSFKLLDKQLSTHEKIPYSFQTDLYVDFLGYIIYKDKLIFYAIIVDLEKLTIGDYLKQYFLQQMNIHLLRINFSSKIELEIKSFLTRICKSRKYIINNGLNSANFKYSTIELLKQFYDDYQYNHINFLKYREHNNDNNNDDDDEIINYSEEPGDIAVNVPSNIIHYLSDKKFIFTK